MTLPFIPRPSQEEILRYTGGRLGIAAVPGAGKTHILSALAAQIIQSGVLQDGQEVLIVTLVNSAVDNFETRIKRFFDSPLQALYKYRVRTLHGLAHDIVREKPSRVGLEERFGIIDEREANLIRRESAMAFLSSNPDFLDGYFDPEMDASKRDWVRRKHLPGTVESIALAFIRSAKDRLLTPEILRAKLDASPASLPLAELGWSIYADYQRALAYRGAVDFDDLIRLALTLLESDSEFLERLRYRYPYILEDEAQDSSRTQERILSLLAGGRVVPSGSEERIETTNAGFDGSGGFDTPFATNAQGYSTTGAGNWVRVGDPNQAIFETFTTASPELLRAFIRENPHVDMPESGRSQLSVIAIANQLIDWVMNAHPVPEVRDALQPPFIQPVPAGDPQPNPPEDSAAIKFVPTKFSPEDEVEQVVKSIAAWLPDNMDKTVAVLTPRNNRGVDVTNALRAKGIEFVEFLNSTTDTRAAAGSLHYLLAYLADPQSASKLSKAYQVYRRDIFGTKSKADATDSTDTSNDRVAGRAIAEGVTSLLRKVGEVESFIAPREDSDWLAALQESEAEPVINELTEFRVHLCRWLDAVTLPVDQLVLTLAQDVFTEAVDLALAHKLALVMRKAADDHASWRLPELTAELAVIAKNERRFIGFSADDSGFNPETHKGKVVVTTMHKAKGLEWDRVYLMSVNNYDFPSGQAYDRYISEKWFARGVSIRPEESGATRPTFNLEAEALAQLTALESSGEYDWYQEGAATMKSRLDYVRERLRLLYVGITRAKKDLIVTWNSGRQGDASPNLAVETLRGWWEGREA